MREEKIEVAVAGSKCRPFIRVEKDPDLFAACNELAEKLGPINSPDKAFELIEEAIGDEINEVFGVFTLDIHLRMKSFSQTGQGESSSVMAPIPATVRHAVMGGGDYAIIFHVHPSGIEAEPSDADRETTEAFVEAFDAVAIPLIDHVIVGGDIKNPSYYSFAEAGEL